MHLYLLVSRNCGENPDDFYLKCNKLQYPVSGNIRKGHSIPIISRIIPYDVRIRKEAAKKYLEDIGAIDLGGKLTSSNHSFHIPKIALFLMRLVRKTGILKDVDYDKSKAGQNLFFHGFTYVIFLGARDDPVDGDGNELL